MRRFNNLPLFISRNQHSRNSRTCKHSWSTVKNITQNDFDICSSVNWNRFSQFCFLVSSCSLKKSKLDAHRESFLETASFSYQSILGRDSQILNEEQISFGLIEVGSNLPPPSCGMSAVVDPRLWFWFPFSDMGAFVYVYASEFR